MTPARRSLLLLLAIVLVTPLLTGGLCGPSPSPSVETDTCGNPAAATISRIELGHLTGAGVATFQPYNDGDSVPLVFGAQGSEMIVLRLRLTGEFSNCVPQQLTVSGDDGLRVSGFSQPVVVDKDAEGRGVSHEIYLPGYYRQVALVKVGAGGAEVSLTFDVGDYPSCSVLANCETRCLTVESCATASCGHVKPARRAAMEAVRECLRQECGLVDPAPGDGGAVVPDGGGSGTPCGNGSHAPDCRMCVENALPGAPGCVKPAQCRQCVAAVNACDAIP